MTLNTVTSAIKRTAQHVKVLHKKSLFVSVKWDSDWKLEKFVFNGIPNGIPADSYIVSSWYISYCNLHFVKKGLHLGKGITPWLMPHWNARMSIAFCNFWLLTHRRPNLEFGCCSFSNVPLVVLEFIPLEFEFPQFIFCHFSWPVLFAIHFHLITLAGHTCLFQWLHKQKIVYILRLNKANV